MGLAVFVVKYASDVMTFELTNRVIDLVMLGMAKFRKIPNFCRV